MIESKILNYWDELNFATEIAHKIDAGQADDRFEGRQAVIRCLNTNGYKQWCILKTIGDACLSAEAKKQFMVLERKFEGQFVANSNNIEFNFVPPPIPAERTKFMTDKQWLKAIKTYKDTRETLRQRGRSMCR